MAREVLVLRESEIRTLLDPPSCLQAVEEALTAYAAGRAELPAVINLDIAESRAEVHVKAGHLHGGSHYAVKIASGFPENARRGESPNDGMVLLFDSRSGAPAALLLDNGFITDRRTGAAGAVAARHLARLDAVTRCPSISISMPKRSSASRIMATSERRTRGACARCAQRPSPDKKMARRLR